MLNVGYGMDHTINEYYNVIAKELKYKGTFEHNLSKPVGMLQKLMDSSVARRYGWLPKTDLRLGIKKTTKWYMEHFK